MPPPRPQSGEQSRARPAAPSFDIAAASLTAEVQSILACSAALHNTLAATLAPATATFSNLVRPLVDDENRVEGRLVILSHLLAGLSPDPDVRAAAQQAKRAMSTAQDALHMRRDLAALVAAVYDTTTAAAPEADGGQRGLDAEDVYFLTKLHGQFTRSGANVHDDAKRARLAAAQVEVGKLLGAALREFGGNAAGGDDGMWLSRADLAGLPSALLSSLKEEEEDHSGGGARLWVTFRDAHYLQVMRHATASSTRRQLYLARQRRFPKNVERLSQVVVLRDEIARLLGYANHGALKMEERMEDSVEGVQTRLFELRQTLEPVARQEAERLLRQKQDEDAASQDDERNTLHVWDRLYYENQQAKTRFSVDSNAVSEYFEVAHTLRGMLQLFQDLFALEFETIDTSVWHPSVMACAVWDHADGAAAFLGYLYLDIFARTGKRGDPHHMAVRQGFTEEDGTRHHPLSVFACSFPEPGPGRPTLLQHRDVRIMFHELGHAVHNLVSRTRYARSNPKDFVEIPSKMLEHWIWEPSILQRLGKHYTCLGQGQQEGGVEPAEGAAEHAGDGGDGRLPRDLAENIARTKSLNMAIGILSMMQPALFDLAVYSPPDRAAALQIDTTAIWNETQRSVFTNSCGMEMGTQDSSFGQAGQSAFFRSYDVAYYGYTTAITIAADLYHSAFSRDPTSRAEGMRYRRLVLEPGSSKPAADVLKQYLGRDPSPEATFTEIAKGAAL